jgi:hypothetical protein
VKYNRNRNLGVQIFGGKDRFVKVMRWSFYSFVLLLFYMLMSGGLFRVWQPILIVPLAIAVAMRQREISASVFGAICGLVIDIAYGRLFGFSGIWLLPGCLMASMMSYHLIKINLLNFLWLNAAVCFLMTLADYFFNYILWGTENSGLVLVRFIIPAHLSAVILSPLVYFVVKWISAKFSHEEDVKLLLASVDEEEDYE